MTNRFIRLMGGNYFFVILMCIFAFVYLLWNEKSNPFKNINIKKYLPLAITSIIVILTYTYYIAAFWCFDRYLYPMFIPLLIVTSFLFTKLYDNIQKFPLKKTILTVIVAIVFIGNFIRPGIKGFLFDKYKFYINNPNQCKIKKLKHHLNILAPALLI